MKHLWVNLDLGKTPHIAFIIRNTCILDKLIVDLEAPDNQLYR